MNISFQSWGTAKPKYTPTCKSMKISRQLDCSLTQASHQQCKITTAMKSTKSSTLIFPLGIMQIPSRKFWLWYLSRHKFLTLILKCNRSFFLTKHLITDFRRCLSTGKSNSNRITRSLIRNWITIKYFRNYLQFEYDYNIFEKNNYNIIECFKDYYTRNCNQRYWFIS